MPRKSRRYTESGIYHIVLKGSGGQILFEDDVDREKFLLYIEEMLSRHHVQLIAWCLMSNHAHFLLVDEEGRISACIHDLATAYAVYFNRRHNKSGAVFDGRFHSVAVESDGQLLGTVRYIHDNPARAGICASFEYPWSSYRAYLSGQSSFTNLEPLYDLIGGREHFEAFSRESKYAAQRIERDGRLTDEDAIALALRVIDVSLGSVKSLPHTERNRNLQSLRDEGLSLRQIERLTGVGRSTISRNTSA